MKKIIFILLILYINISALKSTVLDGKSLSEDSTPMIQSHILIKPIVESLHKKESLYECDVDGKFNIEILDTGFVFIRFSGVDHQPY
jgi:hypothetical protein